MNYVQIEDGRVVNRVVFDGPMPEDWPGFGSYVQHDDAQIGWGYDGETLVAPEPETGSGITPPVATPRLIATGVLAISDGMVSGIETAVGISAAFAMGAGSYWIFFTQDQPNLAYSYNVSASSGQINVTTRETSFIEVTATEGGVPTDPVEISLQVARVK